MRVASYARVSTRKEEQKNSLQNQIALGENISRENGFTVVRRYIDNGISGSGIKNRTAITELLEDAKMRKFDVVIAKSVSRLGRNTLNSLQMADLLEKIPVRLILPEDNYDTDKSKSRFMFNLKAILAEEENAKLAERIKLGLQSSAKQGKRRVSLPPYGYTIHPITKQLEIEETTSQIVKEIFKLYLNEGWGMFKISNYLMQKKTATPRTASDASNAGNKWHQSTIKKILTNPVYTGKLVFHREETTGTLSESETYKIRRRVNPDKQIIIQTAHPAIISDDDFIAVQDLMKMKGKCKNNGKENLFAHIAVCADCNSGMHFKHDRRDGAYVCGGYVKFTSKYCSSHIIEEKALLKAVKDDLKALMNENIKSQSLYGLAEEEANVLQSSTLREIKRIDKQITELDKRFDKLLSLHVEDKITAEQFKQQNDIILKQQSDLVNKKAEMQSVMEAKKDLDEEFRTFNKEVQSFINLDFEDQQVIKQILQRLIVKIEVYEGGEINIKYNLSCPTSLNLDTV